MDDNLLNNIIDMINLYKEKEELAKTNLHISIDDDNPNKRLISISYGDDYSNKTESSTENIAEFDNHIIYELINYFKKDEYFKEENIACVNESKCNYKCVFNSGRKIILENVNFSLINSIKSLITGQVYQVNNLANNKKEVPVNTSGFSNYLILIVTMLLILNTIFVLILWLKNMN